MFAGRTLALVEFLFCIGFAATLSTASNAAGAGDLTPDYLRCINRTQTNFGWDRCGAAEIDRQETKLAVAWKKALKCFDISDQTSRDAKQSLIEEERTWIVRKDAACKFYFPSKEGDSSQGYAGREGEVLGAPSCKAGIVSQRATFLEDLAHDCR